MSDLVTAYLVLSGLVSFVALGVWIKALVEAGEAYSKSEREKYIFAARVCMGVAVLSVLWLPAVVFILLRLLIGALMMTVRG